MKNIIPKLITAALLALLVVAPAVVQAATLSNMTVVVQKTTAIITGGINATGTCSTAASIYLRWDVSDKGTIDTAWANGTSTNYGQNAGSLTTWGIGGLGECSKYTARTFAFEYGCTTSTCSSALLWTNGCPIAQVGGMIQFGSNQVWLIGLTNLNVGTGFGTSAAKTNGHLYFNAGSL